MSAPIDVLATRSVAELAKLDLTEQELTLFSGQLAQIISYVQNLGEIEGVAQVAPLYHPFELPTLCREDTSALSDTLVLESAPEVEDRSFKVPKILGGAT